MYHRDTDFFV